MRKNCKDVLEAWHTSSRKRTCDSIWTENGKVYSYRTLIAERRYDSIVGKWLFFVNMTKYSSTTSVHQNAIWSYLQSKYPDDIYIVFDDLYRGVQDLQSLYPAEERSYKIIQRVAA